MTNTTFSNNRAIIRSRNWFLVSYLSFEEITEYCKMGHISRYAFIKHDKDDGKEPHYHLLVVYKNARTWSAVVNDFRGRSQNTMCEQCLELDASYDYLTHKRNPEKYQYDSNDIVCDDKSYWESLVCDGESNKATELISDILAGKNPVYLLKRYGRDFVLNHQRYYDFAMNIGTLDESVYDSVQRAKQLEEEKRIKTALLEFNGPEQCYIPSFVYYDEDGRVCESIY